MTIRNFEPKNIIELKELEARLQKHGYRNLSGGPKKLMEMDKKLYKGVTAIIVKYPQRKNYYLFYIREKSFFKHGHKYG